MNTPCSVRLLESALDGNLPEEDEAALHQHLEECEACSAALEQMAGGQGWCREAVTLLLREKLDVVAPTREQWSDVDFTVEHLEPADEPNLLGRLGGYDVLEIIGHGGMGVVLKGFDRQLKRCVAIKVLAPHLAQNSLARRRFAREAQAAAAVVHPHVLAIHQVQPSGRLPFLVMPLVAGESLAQRLKTQGMLELKEILRVGMQAAAGLAAAHEQGLVHRDVKPGNILLEKGIERAVLMDFGLARAADDVTLTRWGIIAGTPQYMSPEQARGETLDARSDLFSLGCVLYEMASGVSPFRTESAMATMRRLIDDSPQALGSLHPELPPWFIAIVERLLEKDPSRRFGSAQEVSELLEGCLAHVQQPASVPLPAGLPKPAVRDGSPFNLRPKGVLAMIAVSAVGLLGALLLLANPPDIAGQWSGDEWGQIVLKKTNDSEYTGTYSDTVGPQTGEIKLKWSRIERRFNGTWREGDDRFGELSLRLTGDQIRGALTTDAKSKINPATPRLADLTWRRAALGNATDGTATGRSKAIEALKQLRESEEAKIKVEILLSNLGRGDRNTDRWADPTVVQWLESLNGRELETLIEEAVVLQKPIEKDDLTKVIDGAYRAILSRPPTAEERTFSETFLSTAPGYREGVQDLYWALLSSSEFRQKTRPMSADPTTTVTLNGTVSSAPTLGGAANVSTNDSAERFLNVVGTIQPPANASHVWAETAGTVVKVLAAPGQHVQKGQAIVELDSSDLTDQVEANKHVVRDLLERVHTYKASPRQPTKEAIDIAQAEFEKARALAEFARSGATRYAKLKDKGAVADAEITNADATLVAREADAKIAQARLQALIEQPKLHQQEWKEAENQLAEAQIRLAESRQLLAAATVRAPVEGTVFSLHVEPGQFVQARTTEGATEICLVADTRDIEIHAQVHLDDASRIDLSKNVDVEITGRGAHWTGRLSLADPEKVGNPVVVLVRDPDWRLYRAGAFVTLVFKLRAAAPDGTSGTSATNRSSELTAGDAAIIDQPAAVSVPPKPGASPTALPKASSAQLRAAERSVQDEKVNFEVTLAALVRSEKSLKARKAEWEYIDQAYHLLLKQFEQKLVDKQLVDETTVSWKAAQAAEQAARADFNAAQAKHEVAKVRLRRAEAELKTGTGSAYLPTVTAIPAADVSPDVRSLTEFRNSNAKTVYLVVTGAVSNSTGALPVWGTDIYTDDSSLAAAAVHAGVLQEGERGVVRVTFLPGQMSYRGQERNGVQSDSYGAWPRSFRVEAIHSAPPVEAPTPPFSVVPAPRDLTGFRQHVGQTYLFRVPASIAELSHRVDGATGLVIAEYPGQVWGSDIYADDSSLATAAVHAGLLVPGMQGVLRVTILPGQEGYEGSTRRGVTSTARGPWDGSFRIEKPTAEDFRRINAADQPNLVPGTVGQQRAKDGDTAVRFEIGPPPASAPSSVNVQQ